jgi:hypothetical protein
VGWGSQQAHHLTAFVRGQHVWSPGWLGDFECCQSMLFCQVQSKHLDRDGAHERKEGLPRLVSPNPHRPRQWLRWPIGAHTGAHARPPACGSSPWRYGNFDRGALPGVSSEGAMGLTSRQIYALILQTAVADGCSPTWIPPPPRKGVYAGGVVLALLSGPLPAVLPSNVPMAQPHSMLETSLLEQDCCP